jgi:hypothetical protein
MTILARGRGALIIAAGIWLCLYCTLPSSNAFARETAASTASGAKHAHAKVTKKFAKHRTHHTSRHAHRAHKTLSRSAARAKARRDHTLLEQADSGDDKLTLPPEVANANAQWPASDQGAGKSNRADAASKSPRSSDAGPAGADAGARIVAPDELNDLDLALSKDRPKPLPVRIVTEASASAANSSDSTWDRTSLIGKLFIAVGGLLTMASAARMFMA